MRLYTTGAAAVNTGSAQRTHPGQTILKCIGLACASRCPESGANRDVQVARESAKGNRHPQRPLESGTNPSVLVPGQDDCKVGEGGLER